MTREDLKLLAECDRKIAEAQHKVAAIIAQARALGRHEFAARLEKYARDNDLLPRH